MNRTPTTPWYNVNIHDLQTGLSAVEQAVEEYSDRHQPKEPTPDIQSALTDVARTINDPPALEYLCTTFHLSLFERQILLLCVAQALLFYFPQLCAQIQEDQHLTYPTFGLAMRLFPNPDWDALLPTAPLQYWQLVKLEQDRK